MACKKTLKRRVKNQPKRIGRSSRISVQKELKTLRTWHRERTHTLLLMVVEMSRLRASHREELLGMREGFENEIKRLKELIQTGIEAAGFLRCELESCRAHYVAEQARLTQEVERLKGAGMISARALLASNDGELRNPPDLATAVERLTDGQCMHPEDRVSLSIALRWLADANVEHALEEEGESSLEDESFS